MKAAYITGNYPSTSERFISREIAALTRRGFQITVFALNRPTGAAPQIGDGVSVVYRPSIFCPCTLFIPLLAIIRHPSRCARAWRHIRRNTPEDMPLLKAFRHFLTALSFARTAEQAGIQHIHAHFAYVTADIGSTMGEMLGVRYTLSVHAWDLYVQCDDAIAARLRSADKVFACTEHGRDRAIAAAKLPDDRVVVVRHGLEPSKWSAGSGESGNVILSVGRLVAKKGFGTLIEACSMLKESGIDFSCVIVGEGPERATLERAIEKSDLSGRVMLRGELAGSAMNAEFASAAVFALPSVVASDGDRDGLPNAALEAMASKLPVLVTTASAAKEVVHNGEQGFVVEPGDAVALLERISALLKSVELRQSMGTFGRSLIEKDFDIDKNTVIIANAFKSCAAARIQESQ